MEDKDSHPFHQIADSWKFDGSVVCTHNGGASPTYSAEGRVVVKLRSNAGNLSAGCIFTPNAFSCCGLIAMSNYHHYGGEDIPDHLIIPALWAAMSKKHGSDHDSYLGSILYVTTPGQTVVRKALESCGFEEVASTTNSAHSPWAKLTVMMFKTDGKQWDVAERIIKSIKTPKQTEEKPISPTK